MPLMTVFKLHEFGFGLALQFLTEHAILILSTLILSILPFP